MRRPGRSWRRWRIRSQRSPGSPLSCHARFAADSKSHQLDRELSALGPATNLTTTVPILPQQRRSAGCFSYPLRTGRTIPFRGKFIGSSRLSSGLQSQAPVGLTSHGVQRHGHRTTRDDWCAGSEPEWQNHEIRMDLSRIDPRSRRPGSRAPASLRMHSLGRFLARRGRVTSIRRSSFSTQSCEVYFRREQEQLTEERIHEVPLPACSGSAAVRHRTSRCRVPRRAGTRHPPRRGRPWPATGGAEDRMGQEPRLLHCGQAAARIRSRAGAPDLPVAGVDAEPDCSRGAHGDPRRAESRPTIESIGRTWKSAFNEMKLTSCSFRQRGLATRRFRDEGAGGGRWSASPSSSSTRPTASRIGATISGPTTG